MFSVYLDSSMEFRIQPRTQQSLSRVRRGGWEGMENQLEKGLSSVLFSLTLLGTNS